MISYHVFSFPNFGTMDKSNKRKSNHYNSSVNVRGTGIHCNASNTGSDHNTIKQLTW